EALAQGGVDRAYVARLRALADGFPPGARWLLFAFDRALDDAGRERPDWTTFHVPDAYARRVAEAAPQRFGWVASIHPLRADALARLDAALAGGALAVKWLPSAMAIDLRDTRLRPFYDRLAATRTPLVVHCGEEKAVPGAGRDELGNPLLVRAPLAAGVRVVVAHCASLGEALDLDRRRPASRPAFELFARLMDEAEWRDRLLGDVSALFQVNRQPEVWRTVLRRADWHPRLLHGSDYPLPGVGLLYSTTRLVHAGLLAPGHAAPLDRLRERNPLLFDFALKRVVASGGARLSDAVFDTRRHFAPALASMPPHAAVDRAGSAR
ncbi:MAG: amidohydrolase family protein, partial [Burkholderiaceae bacterium]